MNQFARDLCFYTVSARASSDVHRFDVSIFYSFSFFLQIYYLMLAYCKVYNERNRRIKENQKLIA